MQTIQCYLTTWYLATDFQLHVFAPVLLIPLALKPVLGYITAGLLILLSTVANLVTVYKEYFPPTDFFIGAMDPRMGPFAFVLKSFKNGRTRNIRSIVVFKS